MSKLRIGVIGAGWAARVVHLPGFRAAGQRMAAICDLDPKPARALAAQYDIPHVYSDWREMLASERFDAVSVCVPNRFHRELVLASLEAGAHVLCEKPLAVTAAEAREMFAAAARHGRILMAAQSFRFDGGPRAIHRVVQAGHLGEIYYAEATAMRRMGIPTWGTFHQSSQSAGGALLDIGVHMLDLAVWLMGNPEPVRVSASIQRRFGHRPEIARTFRNAWDPERFDVEDFAVALVRFANGATLIVRSAWAAHIEKQVFNVTLCGDEAEATTHPPVIYRTREGIPADERLQVGETHMYERVIAHWVRVLRGESEPAVKPAETINVQRILDAAYRSAEEGREVSVEPAGEPA